MKRFLSAAAYSLTLCLLFGSFVNAQRTNFSGNWVAAGYQSISGKVYSNGAPKQLKAIQNDSQVIIETVTAGSNGAADILATQTLGFDGNKFESKTPSGRTKVTRLTWNGSIGFTTVSELYSANDLSKLDMRITDIWTLSNGKLQIQRKREITEGNEVSESITWYEKP